MKFIPRNISGELKKAAKHFPCLILSGPRRAGKTTLLRKTFPKASYYLLEDPDMVARVKDDPRSFIEEVKLPAILDEIQNVPQILNYIRTVIDKYPAKKGEWLLTGSQEAPLMKGVTESMAGRAAIMQLLPLSKNETKKVSLFRGGFPEVLASPTTSDIWFRSYIQTYLERDVRSISSIRDLSTFRRFLSILATRAGQTLNRSDLATPLGVSVPTISEWLNILEATSQIIIVPPYFENFGKRLIKSPKLYFTDSGLLCYILGINSPQALDHSPFLGSIFEGFVASEIVKQQYGTGKRKELYFFRDRQGLEVDFLIPRGNRRLALIETKATKTIRPSMAQNIGRLKTSIKNYSLDCFLVHLPVKSALGGSTLKSQIKATPSDSIASII